jgi:integrase
MPCKEQVVRENVTTLNRCMKYHTGVDVIKKMDILWNRPMVNRLFIETSDFCKMYAAADPKERMILVLGAAMGLRRREIWGMMLSDISDDIMTIKGKGHGKNGLVVRRKMPSIVKNELDAYMGWRSDFTGKDRSDERLIVFKDYDGNIVKYKNEVSIWQVVVTLAGKIGIRATPHSLRRLFCTELYENGCDPLVLMELMRHCNYDTLRLYIRHNDKKQNEELEKMTSELITL